MRRIFQVLSVLLPLRSQSIANASLKRFFWLGLPRSQELLHISRESRFLHVVSSEEPEAEISPDKVKLSPEQHFRIGSRLITHEISKEREEALNHFRAAANEQHPEALAFLARAYANGHYGLRYDRDAAFVYFKLAADLGHTPSLMAIGECYEKGDGVHQNIRKSIGIYAQAAELGDLDAHTRIAHLYSTAPFTDLPYAFKHYKYAADNGDVDAQYRVAKCYSEGTGVEVDNQLAGYYRNLANKDSGAQ
jgi:TPR repeat protein